MIAIVAVDKNWGIGKNGNLLMRIPDDMRFFKEKTINNTVIMGRKTFESLPNKKPLPNRTNVVLTRNQNFHPDGVTVLHSVEEVEKYIVEYESPNNKIFCIGGGEIYTILLPLCAETYVTYINAEFDADTYFPNLDEMGWKDVGWNGNEEDYWKEYEGVRYAFETYKNPRFLERTK